MAYWNEQGLTAALVEKLRQGPQEFPSEAAWQARLADLGITSARHVRIPTERALLGGLIERGVSPELVVLSNGAPPFDILRHASCWVHAERPLARMAPHNHAQLEEDVPEAGDELQSNRHLATPS